MLQVLGRTHAQTKQFRKGLKDTGIWPLITERPDVVPLLFPRQSEVELKPQVSVFHNEQSIYLSVCHMELHGFV